MSVDLDYRSPRGITIRVAVERLLAASTRTANGCLIARTGPHRYAEVRASGARMGAHVAVVLLAGEQDPTGQVVRHSCDTPGCIERTHLVVGTQSQNVHDEYLRERRDGGWARGEQRPNAVMTERDVITMRRLAAAGHTLGEIVDRFGHSYSSTRMAIRGETWAHVTDPPPVPGRTNQVGNPHAYRLTRRPDAAEAARLASDGQSLAQIGSHLGCSRSTAWKLLHVARKEISA